MTTEDRIQDGLREIARLERLVGDTREYVQQLMTQQYLEKPQEQRDAEAMALKTRLRRRAA
jgi:hypothetical protein